MRLGPTRAANLRAIVRQQQGGFNHLDHRDVECTDCHTSRETHGQVTIEPGAACQQCHHTRPVVDRGCAGCHGRGELAEALPMRIQMEISRQGVTKHLEVLSQAGVVRDVKSGRERLWQLEPGQIEEAKRTLELIGRQWETALGKLKAFVEKD